MADFLFDMFFEVVGAFIEMGIKEAIAQRGSKQRDKASRGLGTI
jgi:hypothetical protein